MGFHNLCDKFFRFDSRKSVFIQASVQFSSTRWRIMKEIILGHNHTEQTWWIRNLPFYVKLKSLYCTKLILYLCFYPLFWHETKLKSAVIWYQFVIQLVRVVCWEMWQDYFRETESWVWNSWNHIGWNNCWHDCLDEVYRIYLFFIYLVIALMFALMHLVLMRLLSKDVVQVNHWNTVMPGQYRYTYVNIKTKLLLKEKY